jgi:hypothetical protein
MTIENIIQWLGGLLAYATLGIILFGVWRDTRRQTDSTVAGCAPFGFISPRQRFSSASATSAGFPCRRCFRRKPARGELMIEAFGAEYKKYIQRTGRLFPKL